MTASTSTRRRRQDLQEFVDGSPPKPGQAFLVHHRLLQPDPKQPRKKFRQDALERLALSIRTVGQLKSVEVRWLAGKNGDPRFQIVDGERRWRAVQLPEAGSPVLKAVLSDSDAEIGGIDDFLDSVVSNFCHEPHTPTEIASACGRLRDERNMSNEQIALAVGLSGASVVNYLSLLRLHPTLFAQLDPDTPDELRIKMVCGLSLARVDHESQLAIAKKLGADITNQKRVSLAVAIRLGEAPESRHPDAGSRGPRPSDHVQLLRRIISALGRNLDELHDATSNQVLAMVGPNQLELLIEEVRAIVQKGGKLYAKLRS